MLMVVGRVFLFRVCCVLGMCRLKFVRVVLVLVLLINLGVIVGDGKSRGVCFLFGFIVVVL